MFKNLFKNALKMLQPINYDAGLCTCVTYGPVNRRHVSLYGGTGLCTGATFLLYGVTPVGHNPTVIQAYRVSAVSALAPHPPVLADAAAAAVSTLALLPLVLADAAAAAFSTLAPLPPVLADAAAAAFSTLAPLPPVLAQAPAVVFSTVAPQPPVLAMLPPRRCVLVESHLSNICTMSC